MELTKEEFEQRMNAIAVRVTDAFKDDPAPGDPETGRLLVVSALCEVLAAVIVETVSPDLTLGVVWRHTQHAASKLAMRDIEPLCPCPACKLERETEGTGVDTSMQMH